MIASRVFRDGGRMSEEAAWGRWAQIGEQVKRLSAQLDSD